MILREKNDVRCIMHVSIMHDATIPIFFMETKMSEVWWKGRLRGSPDNTYPDIAGNLIALSGNILIV